MSEHECCCVCKHHYALFGHPDFNGTVNTTVGWVCFTQPPGGLGMIQSTRHGMCELFDGNRPARDPTSKYDLYCYERLYGDDATECPRKPTE